MARPAAKAKFFNDLTAPEIFAAGASGFAGVQGNVVLTFEAPRFDHADPQRPMTRAVVLRLVLPLAGVQALALSLYDYLEKQGVASTAAPKNGAPRRGRA